MRASSYRVLLLLHHKAYSFGGLASLGRGGGPRDRPADVPLVGNAAPEELERLFGLAALKFRPPREQEFELFTSLPTGAGSFGGHRRNETGVGRWTAG